MDATTVELPASTFKAAGGTQLHEHVQQNQWNVPQVQEARECFAPDSGEDFLEGFSLTETFS